MLICVYISESDFDQMCVLKTCDLRPARRKCQFAQLSHSSLGNILPEVAGIRSTSCLSTGSPLVSLLNLCRSQSCFRPLQAWIVCPALKQGEEEECTKTWDLINLNGYIMRIHLLITIMLALTHRAR